MADQPKKKSSCPPPPYDPFPTYQSPFPRSSDPSADENPFIAFRRFADSQISHFLHSFSGFSSLFTDTPRHPFLPPIDEVAMKHRQEIEEGWKKAWEQQREELRSDVENTMRKWGEELGRSERARETSQAQSPDPRTELDLYQQDQSDKCPRRKHPVAKNWLDSFGHDGKQKSKTKSLYVTGKGNSDNSSTHVLQYTTENSGHYDPIDRPSMLMGWLLTSPYSPVYLCNPEQKRVAKVDVVDGYLGPMSLEISHFTDPSPSQLDEDMSRAIPWADAFEDLLSLQNKGSVVERDFSTWRTPNTWVHDMVKRGSLGPRWQIDGSNRLSWNRSFPFWGALDPAELGNLDALFLKWDGTRLPPDGLFLRAISDHHVTHHDENEMKNTGYENGQKFSTSEILVASVPKETAQDQDANPVVSTRTTTQGRTRPDGTVETRSLFEKRLANGEEVKHETQWAPNSIPRKFPAKAIEEGQLKELEELEELVITPPAVSYKEPSTERDLPLRTPVAQKSTQAHDELSPDFDARTRPAVIEALRMAREVMEKAHPGVNFQYTIAPSLGEPRTVAADLKGDKETQTPESTQKIREAEKKSGGWFWR